MKKTEKNQEDVQTQLLKTMQAIQDKINNMEEEIVERVSKTIEAKTKEEFEKQIAETNEKLSEMNEKFKSISQMLQEKDATDSKVLKSFKESTDVISKAVLNLHKMVDSIPTDMMNIKIWDIDTPASIENDQLIVRAEPKKDEKTGEIKSKPKSFPLHIVLGRILDTITYLEEVSLDLVNSLKTIEYNSFKSIEYHKAIYKNTNLLIGGLMPTINPFYRYNKGDGIQVWEWHTNPDWDPIYKRKILPQFRDLQNWAHDKMVETENRFSKELHEWVEEQLKVPSERLMSYKKPTTETKKLYRKRYTKRLEELKKEKNKRSPK